MALYLSCPATKSESSKVNTERSISYITTRGSHCSYKNLRDQDFSISTQLQYTTNFFTCQAVYKLQGFLNDLAQSFQKARKRILTMASGRKDEATLPLMDESLHQVNRLSNVQTNQTLVNKMPCLLTCVPDLCLDSFSINLYTSGSEFYSNGGLRLQIELVSCEPREEI